MRERAENITGQREKDDALMNFVSRQAQEVILNPILPESYKDEVLEAAVETIHRVAERKAAYYAKYGEGRRTRHTQQSVKETPPKQPDIFVEVNAYLEAKTLLDSEIPTIQRIAGALGISEGNLNEWVKTDEQFRGWLQKLTKIQAENLISEPEFDNRADVMLVALFLLETKNRYDRLTTTS